MWTPTVEDAPVLLSSREILRILNSVLQACELPAAYMLASCLQKDYSHYAAIHHQCSGLLLPSLVYTLSQNQHVEGIR